MLRRLPALLPVLIALIPWAWILAPLMSGNRFYISEDASTLQFQYPMHHLLGTSLREGRLPLWTPLLSGGYPVMAEGTAGTMYPLNLFLFRYFSPYNAYQIAMALAVLFTFVTTDFYLRHRHHSRLAALLGAACFSMGGYAVGHLRDLDQLQAMSMLPLVLMFAEMYLDRRRLVEALLCGSALAVAILAGTGQVPYLIGWALVLLVLTRAGERPDPARFVGIPLSSFARSGRWFVLGVALLPIVALIAGLLAAPQILLSMDLLPFTEWADGFSLEQAREGALGLSQLVHFVAPHAHGIPVVGTYSLPGRFHETLAYLGLIPLVLCLFIPFIVIRRDRRVLFPLLLTLVALLLATGPDNPLLRDVWKDIPGVSWLRFPGRFLLLANLGLAMMAALGLDFLIGLFENHPHPMGQRFALLLPLFILGVTVVDLGYHGSSLLAWMDPEEVLQSPLTRQRIPGLGHYRMLSLAGGGQRAGIDQDGTGNLQRDPSPFLVRRSLLWRNYNAVHDVAVVGGDLSFPLRHHRALETRLLEGLEPIGSGARQVSAEAINLFNFFGVRLVLSYTPLLHPKLVPLDPIQVPGVLTPIQPYGIEDLPPRAYLARGVKRCGTEATLQRLIAGRFGSGWQPCREGGAQEGFEPDESSGVAGYATLSARGDTFVEFTVNLLNPGYLVVRDSYAPGWISEVDGALADTIPVDFIYRATPVPAGKHKVLQEYRPRGIGTGLGLNMLGLLAVGVGIMASRASQQRLALGDDRGERGADDDWFR